MLRVVIDCPTLNKDPPTKLHVETAEDDIDNASVTTLPKMSGRGLLDALALFNASRAVVSQHLRIRSQQLDVYSKSSTVARAVWWQKESVAQTAASSAPRPSTAPNANPLPQAHSITSSPQPERIPSSESVQDLDPKDQPTEGLEQDHSYKPQDNSVLDCVPGGELALKQERASSYPFPVGKVPSLVTAVDGPKTDRDIHIQRPAAEPIKHPWSKVNKVQKSSNLNRHRGRVFRFLMVTVASSPRYRPRMRKFFRGSPSHKPP